jgi:hypothetical protein
MSSRELARVLIRVTGVGFLAYDVLGLGVGVLQLATVDSFARDVGEVALGYVLVPLAISIFLIRQADWIADRFRIGSESPATSAPSGAVTSVDSDGLFRVGCALLGVYCLTRIAGPIASIIHEWTRREAGDVLSAWLSPTTAVGRNLIEIGLELVLGLVLLIGPGRIGRWLRRTFTASSPVPDAPPSA